MKKRSERDERVRARYQEWAIKMHNGKRIHTDDYIIDLISEEFFIAVSTAERIIFHWGYYKANKNL